MPPRRSPLYSAVVLARVSLTSTALSAACGDDDNTTTPGDACPPDSEIPTPPCALIK